MFCGVYNFNIQIPCFVTFIPSCYLLWTRVVCIIMKSKTKLAGSVFYPLHQNIALALKWLSIRESLKFWTDQKYTYNRFFFFTSVFPFNSLVHLLRVMNRTIYLTFTQLLEFTKPSGISFTLCVHVINKLFNCIFLCAGDMCQVYVWITCLYLWSKSIKRQTTTVILLQTL